MVDDNPPLMMSIHQLTSLGNFGTFSNFSLFFAPWNITKIIILCHYHFVFAFAIASPEPKFWQNQKTSSGFEGHHYCTTPGTKSSSKKSSLAIYLYKVEWWLFDAHPKHFDQVWVVQGFHHLLMRILNLRRH